MRYRHELAIAVALLAISCHSVLTVSTIQPNPLQFPKETLRESAVLAILSGDKDLRLPSGNRFPLVNKVNFHVVSMDRLRFHVQLEHKWKEYADLKSWDVVLTNDRGIRFYPDNVEVISNLLQTRMWDQERRTAVRNSFGDIVQVNNDGYKQMIPMASVSWWRCRGDLVFYARNLFSSNTSSITLELTRGSVTYRYTWQLTTKA